MRGPAPVPAARRRTLRRRAALFGTLLGLVSVAGFVVHLVWANTYPRGPLFDPIADLPDPLPADAAELHARRIAVAFGDTQRMWSRHIEGALGRSYRRPRLEIFTRGTQTPCAPGVTTAGPFYCAAEATLGFDLLFSEALSRRLRRDAELGATLLVARLVGAHVRRQLGHGPAAPEPLDARAEALAADCLAGVWAHARADRLGPVEPGFYGRLIQTARNTAGDLARVAPRIAADVDPLRHGRIPAREAAFQAGFRTGEPALCSVAGTVQAAR